MVNLPPLATVTQCASLVTAARSIWELSRMIRTKRHELKQTKEVEDLLDNVEVFVDQGVLTRREWKAFCLQIEEAIAKKETSPRHAQAKVLDFLEALQSIAQEYAESEYVDSDPDEPEPPKPQQMRIDSHPNNKGPEAWSRRPSAAPCCRRASESLAQPQAQKLPDLPSPPRGPLLRAHTASDPRPRSGSVPIMPVGPGDRMQRGSMNTSPTPVTLPNHHPNNQLYRPARHSFAAGPTPCYNSAASSAHRSASLPNQYGPATSFHNAAASTAHHSASLPNQYGPATSFHNACTSSPNQHYAATASPNRTGQNHHLNNGIITPNYSNATSPRGPNGVPISIPQPRTTHNYNSAAWFTPPNSAPPTSPLVADAGWPPGFTSPTQEAQAQRAIQRQWLAQTQAHDFAMPNLSTAQSAVPNAPVQHWPQQQQQHGQRQGSATPEQVVAALESPASESGTYVDPAAGELRKRRRR